MSRIYRDGAWGRFKLACRWVMISHLVRKMPRNAPGKLDLTVGAMKGWEVFKKHTEKNPL